MRRRHNAHYLLSDSAPAVPESLKLLNFGVVSGALEGYSRGISDVDFWGFSEKRGVFEFRLGLRPGKNPK